MSGKKRPGRSPRLSRKLNIAVFVGTLTMLASLEVPSNEAKAHRASTQSARAVFAIARVDVTNFGMTNVPEPEGFWVEEVTPDGAPQVEQLVRNGVQYASAVIRRVALIPTGPGVRTIEPIGVETTYGIEPTVLRLSEYGVVSYAQTIVANDRLLADHPDAVKAFLGATFAGWTKALADIPAAAEIVVDRFVAPDSKYRDLPYQTRSLELIADYVLLNVGLEGIGSIDPAAWSKASDLMVRYGIIDQAPDLEAFLATGFWPAG